LRPERFTVITRVPKAALATLSLTDIPEAVTFITNGCPEWEQFE
jgi:hypothetical protein